MTVLGVLGRILLHLEVCYAELTREGPSASIQPRAVPISWGDASQLGDKAVELVDHGVDGVLQVQHLAAHVGRHLLAEVPVGNGADDTLHLAGGADQRVDQAVDGLDAARPSTGTNFLAPRVGTTRPACRPP
jgi:hypothetical protein